MGSTAQHEMKSNSTSAASLCQFWGVCFPCAFFDISKQRSFNEGLKENNEVLLQMSAGCSSLLKGATCTKTL